MCKSHNPALNRICAKSRAGRLALDSTQIIEERMPSVQPSALPECALLNRYAQSGAYTDCYHVDVPMSVSLAQYVRSFYTTPLFKVERSILALIARRPSTDKGAEDLASNQTTRFSAWDVEDRNSNQLLLRDFMGRTRSWLMVTPLEQAGSTSTRPYFGSAVVPKSITPGGIASFGVAFHALSGFHHLYSKALVRAAQSNLGNESR